MAKPTLSQVFGEGTAVIPSGGAVSEDSLVIPLGSALGENGYFDGTPNDASEMLMRVILKAMQTLNESARQNQPGDIPLTVTYGEYDAIVDPPGSGLTYRRDVWSIVAYQQVSFGAFDPSVL